MDILDRYIIKSFFSFFFLIAVGLIILFIGIDFLNNMWGSSLPLSKLSLLYFLKIPETFQLFLPLTVLMTTMLVLSSMSSHNEILTLYINGIGLKRILITLLILVLTIIIVTFTVLDHLIPVATKKQIFIKEGKNQLQELYGYRTGVWYRSKDRIYNFSRYIGATNTLENVSIYILDSNDKIKKIVYAKNAIYKNNDWFISDGKTVYYDSSFPRIEKFTDISGFILENPTDFKTFEVNEKVMTLKSLKTYVNKNKNYGLNVINEEIAFHLRIASVFSPIILMFFGIIFFINPLRTLSTSKSVGICFLLTFVYYLIQRFSVSTAKVGYISPIIAAWFSNFLFFISELYFLFKKSRNE